MNKNFWLDLGSLFLLGAGMQIWVVTAGLTAFFGLIVGAVGLYFHDKIVSGEAYAKGLADGSYTTTESTTFKSVNE